MYKSVCESEAWDLGEYIDMFWSTITFKIYLE